MIKFDEKSIVIESMIVGLILIMVGVIYSIIDKPTFVIGLGLMVVLIGCAEIWYIRDMRTMKVKQPGIEERRAEFIRDWEISRGNYFVICGMIFGLTTGAYGIFLHHGIISDPFWMLVILIIVEVLSAAIIYQDSGRRYYLKVVEGVDFTSPENKK